MEAIKICNNTHTMTFKMNNVNCNNSDEIIRQVLSVKCISDSYMNINSYDIYTHAYSLKIYAHFRHKSNSFQDCPHFPLLLKVFHPNISLFAMHLLLPCVLLISYFILRQIFVHSYPILENVKTMFNYS